MLFSKGSVHAQEQYQLNQFIYSAHAINPAFGGIEDLVSINLGLRKQWSAINESPATYYLGFNGSWSGIQNGFSDKRTLRTSVPRLYRKMQDEKGSISHGVGFYLMGDAFGPFHRNAVQLSYAFIYQLNKKYRLSVGLAAEIANQRINGGKITVYNPTQDPIYQKYAGDNTSATVLNINPGIVFYGNKVFIGYSVHRLASIQLSSNDIEEAVLGGLYHYMIAGYNFSLGAQTTFQPSAFVKYNKNFNPVVDVVAKLKYREFFWGGFSYRHNDAAGFLFGFLLAKKAHLNYAFEYPITDIGSYGKGSHELVLGYRIFSDRVSRPLLW